MSFRILEFRVLFRTVFRMPLDGRDASTSFNDSVELEVLPNPQHMLKILHYMHT